jgi:hypothetical protein
MVYGPVVADLHHFDEEQDPDPHQSQKSYPDPHQSDKSDPGPHQSEKADPDPHQSDSRIRIRIKIKRADPDPHQSDKPDPDLHQSEKSDPDRISDADSQHCPYHFPTLTNVQMLTDDISVTFFMLNVRCLWKPY